MACLKKVNGLFALIDNYDSFTYNLLHYMAELGAEVEVFRNDEISVAELAKMTPEGIVLSPGPKTPDFAGICLPPAISRKTCLGSSNTFIKHPRVPL